MRPKANPHRAPICSSASAPGHGGARTANDTRGRHQTAVGAPWRAGGLGSWQAGRLGRCGDAVRWAGRSGTALDRSRATGHEPRATRRGARKGVGGGVGEGSEQRAVAGLATARQAGENTALKMARFSLRRSAAISARWAGQSAPPRGRPMMAVDTLSSRRAWRASRWASPLTRSGAPCLHRPAVKCRGGAGRYAPGLEYDRLHGHGWPGSARAPPCGSKQGSAIQYMYAARRPRLQREGMSTLFSLSGRRGEPVPSSGAARGRPAQRREEQSRAEQSRAEQSRAEQSPTGLRVPAPNAQARGHI